MPPEADLFAPLPLPNGVELKNRIIKSAMSDMLGDGAGNPTGPQARLYERWAEGGVAASILGEVQGDPRFPEAAGNLVLGSASDEAAFRTLTRAGVTDGSALWAQLGHAGALTPAAIGTPAGPSRIDRPELQARALRPDEIRALPQKFAESAQRAERLGFAGVQIHAAHGFLLSQFLSPLFNRRGDAYGGSVTNRARLLLEVVEAVRSAVSPGFTVALKLNSSDELEGGFVAQEALQVIKLLEGKGLDLIDISGGTYFPGAPASSDRASAGPYFLEFAAEARRLTSLPLMATGGFKRRDQAMAAIASGVVDAVGLARALVLDPALAQTWARGQDGPAFPTIKSSKPGAVTAWYAMRLKDLSEDREATGDLDADAALAALEKLVGEKSARWIETF